MPFVVDASTALTWCFEDGSSDEGDQVLDRFRDDHAVVPQLWELEVANALLVAERRGRVTEAQATRIVSLLSALPISIDPTGPAMTTLLATGRQHRLSAYDSTYLVLAARDGLPLATLDEKLRRAARAAGVALFA